MDDTLKGARRDLTKKDVDQEKAEGWRRVFDRVMARRNAFSMLSLDSQTRATETLNLAIVRDEHTRLALGLYKLLWKVE